MEKPITMREHPAVRVLFDAINIMFFDDALLPPELFMDDNVPFAGCYLRSAGEDCIIINAELLQPSASFYARPLSKPCSAPPPPWACPWRSASARRS